MQGEGLISEIVVDVEGSWVVKTFNGGWDDWGLGTEAELLVVEEAVVVDAVAIVEESTKQMDVLSPCIFWLMVGGCWFEADDWVGDVVVVVEVDDVVIEMDGKGK